MKKENFLPLIYFLSSLRLYLGISFLPADKWVHENQYSFLILSGFYLLLLILLVFDSRKYRRKGKGSLPFYYTLPFLLLCLSNTIYGLLFVYIETPFFFPDYFFCYLPELFLKVIIEEILFRILLVFFFQKAFEKTKHSSLYTILSVSFCFSLRHAANFIGNNPGDVLVQMGYSFFISLFLTAYSLFCTSKLLLPSLYHFLFNLLNYTGTVIFFTNIRFDTKFYLFSVGRGALVVFISFFLYLIYRHKRKHAKPEL